MKGWKLNRMCDNCPFSDEGAGLQLRLSLSSKRWQDILDGLSDGQHFLCHKTTNEYTDTDYNEVESVDDEPISREEEARRYPNGKICAGARAWQKERDIVSDAEQIMTRIEATNRRKK